MDRRRSSTGSPGSLDVNDLVNALNSVKVVRCDEVQLRIAGLSLAAWNVVASTVLAAYAALAAQAVEGLPKRP